MKNYIPILRKTQLFAGIGEDKIDTMLGCLQASLHTYQKGEYVFRQEEHLNHIAILAEGNLHVQNDDYWGHHSIVNVINVGEMFGEAYAAPDSGALLNDVVAAKDSAAIFFDVCRILTVCPSACKFHSMVVQNLFFAVSEQNRKLVQKLGHMSNRSTREKLMSYLSAEAKKQKNFMITIPFNRQQLADYLSVDRSAMSNELCKMRDEGLLTFEKNKFSLIV